MAGATGDLPAGLGGGMITGLYLVMAAIYFMPTLFLYRFSVKTRAAIDAYDSAGLNDGLSNLKSMFKFMGILMICILGIYGLAIGISIVIAIFAAF